MSVQISREAARLGVAALAVAVVVAGMGQPSAAQSSAPATASGGDAAAKVAKGRDLFANLGCGSCHALADAGASGHVGPSLDGDSNLTQAFVVARVTSGQGGMPAFADQLSADDIAALATYVTQAASK